MNAEPSRQVRPWRVPWCWRLLLAVAPAVVFPFCRLRVEGRPPVGVGPLILAVNHVGPADPMVLTAACRRVGLAPRFLATGGIFDAPVVGAVMRRCGHIRVDRHGPHGARALVVAAQALGSGSVLLVYPEGRIGLDPWMWPERGKTGAARMAAASGAPVVPVAQWGVHEVVPYAAPRGVLRALLVAVVRRPVVRVRFGEVVDLSQVSGPVGAWAVGATELIMDGIDRTLVGLRRDEPREPRVVDPTRPVDLSRVRRPR